MNEIALKTENLDKIYKLGGRQVRALSDVNLDIEKGDFLSIMGPSGSGKSTLLNILGCLDTPTNGTAFLDGVNVTKVAEKNLYKLERTR